jgi:hypothetical protein
VSRRVGQRHAFVLRRDVAEVPRELAELRDGAHAPIREGPASPFGLDDTAEHELPVAGDACRLELRRDPGARCDVEERLDLRLARAASDQLGARPAADDQPKRVDEHGLARPGLARDDVEAGAELQGLALDEHEVLDGELDEHGRSHMPSSPGRRKRRDPAATTTWGVLRHTS